VKASKRYLYTIEARDKEKGKWCGPWVRLESHTTPYLDGALHMAERIRRTFYDRTCHARVVRYRREQVVR
jgi:hypothetical protein